ncbi:hypothetical protein RHGRI_038101 [Rhododendron griersonianum]|uniref:P-type Cu(+) transporter n=1 Tax=Rhododendron griersonianum TaxID=479676 RepID=A0AAV6HXK1_9ERIC|nr:hypothetical protein RHGRI_038101 [Rhododendron griersonianum]
MKVMGGELEVNGKGDLKVPFLRSSESVAVSLSLPIHKGDDKVKTIKFQIRGIKCASSSTSIESALRKLNGVKNAMVSPLEGQAVVRFMPDLITAKTIKETVEATGFQVGEFRNQDIAVCRLRIKGMACTNCSESSERALSMVDGVKKAVVGLALEEAKVHFDPNVTNTDRIIEAVKDAGFGADLISSGNDVNKVHLQLEGIKSAKDLISILSSLESLEGVNHVEMDMEHHKVSVSYDSDITGPRFYVGSYHALRRRSANMDVLVALGTNAAYFYSIYVVIKVLTSDTFEGQDFFETSSMLISFILLGKYLEVVAKGKTSDALSKLADLAPDIAHLLTLDGDGNVVSEMEISTQLLQKNDIIKIIPGGKVPVDGIVINGRSHVNESMVTGEAMPVTKSPGDKVIGGTVNENGCLLVKATHVGAETALSQIVQIVEAAQLSRAPVQKLADQISKYFVPTIVLAAFITWLGWFITGEAGIYPKHWIPKAMDAFELALQFGISVLVVACPCALGLATPTAVMVATGKGASQGVLIKGGNALEKAHKVKTVVFDKTGTLTIGKPAVVGVMLFSKFSVEEFCDVTIAVEVGFLVCSLNANSEHPIAKAVLEHAKKIRQKYGSRTVHIKEVKDFEVHPGSGVGGKVGERRVFVGNKRLMRSFNVSIGPEVDNYISDTEQLAHTCVLVAIDQKVAGAFSVTDPVKPEAERVIAYLQSMGISSIMVTGDNWATATAVAKQVGIQKVFAETDPLGKADKIKDLQMEGMTVAMVGDGINDSPALVAADVGMAIGAGTDIAIEAADIVLIKNTLEDVITAIHLSKKTMSRIRLNYVWALGYNVLGVPVAAGILFPFTGVRLPPWLAGACMAASSISVVCSSLLLQYYKKPLNLRINK